ncbi:hypothetical protein [Aliiroseovarius sp. S253]|uniref:hypothetical protein n=1 Tax=Aliiroseovarius sp. S253 TaxID=3415133 RepID=UPI003C7DEC45
MKSLTVLAFIASTGAAFAGGASYDVSGTTVGKSENKYMPLGETHVFVDLKSMYTLPENGSPLDGMTGECLGSMQIALGSGASGMGVCTWSDADGDTWFGPWNVTGMTPERASVGTWYVAGGTGKFANATGGGTFTTATNPETGDSKLDVLGSVAVN